MKGWSELCSPNSMPVGRHGTCGTTRSPRAASSSTRASMRRQPVGSCGVCAIAKVIARPLSRQNWRIHANSSFEPTPSDTISNTPWPASPMARPIASSSSGCECVPGTRPCTERCRMVREVLKPTAPAREPFEREARERVDLVGA